MCVCVYIGERPELTGSKGSDFPRGGGARARVHGFVHVTCRLISSSHRAERNRIAILLLICAEGNLVGSLVVGGMGAFLVEGILSVCV